MFLDWRPGNHTRFREVRLETFLVILLTDKQMDRHWQGHNLVGGNNNERVQRTGSESTCLEIYI